MAIPYLQPNDDFYHPDDPDRKQCRRCFERVPRTEFHRSSASKDGLVIYCKSCVREYQRELAERKRQGDFRRMVYRASLAKKDKVVIEWARRIMRRFGGPKKSAEFAYGVITRAAEADVPRSIVLEFLSLLMRIEVYERQQLDELRKRQPPVETLTDSEIAAELRKIAGL